MPTHKTILQTDGKMIESLYAFFLKLKAAHIRDKRLRKKYKRIYMARYYWQKMESVRWGVSYSVFDGEELLEASLRCIRPQVDYINVVYQNISWYGEPSSQPLLPLLEKFLKQGLIDKIILYEPNLKMAAGTNEQCKRNLGLQQARRDGVRYYMTMDVDEFYFPQEMAAAKYAIIKKHVTRSCVKQETYGGRPTEKRLYNRGCFVPFFSRINIFSRHGKDHKLPCLCDPTRQLQYQPGNRYYIFEQCSMHHMSKVRKDIEKKLRNSSGGTARLKKKQSPLQLLSAEVENWFNIRI